MATLTLSKVWVNRMDSGEAVSAWSAPGRGESYAAEGEVRTYAGGRRRSITKEGELGKFTVTMRVVSAADVETLRSWKGILVQVRDHRGRRFFGVYRAVATAEYHDASDLYDVSIELDTVSATEAV